MRTYDRALGVPSMLHMHQRRLCAGIEERSIGRREDQACRPYIEYHVAMLHSHPVLEERGRARGYGEGGGVAGLRGRSTHVMKLGPMYLDSFFFKENNVPEIVVSFHSLLVC